MRKDRTRTRAARFELHRSLTIAFEGHECFAFFLPGAERCLLCSAMNDNLLFVAYALLDKAGRITPLMQTTYSNYCKCFSQEKIDSLVNREKHKVLQLPWIYCQHCEVTSPQIRWARGRSFDKEKQVLSCSYCGNQQVFLNTDLQKLYRKQKEAFQRMQTK